MPDMVPIKTVHICISFMHKDPYTCASAYLSLYSRACILQRGLNSEEVITVKLKHIHSEMRIRTTPERMWEILSQYGDVSAFHAGVQESHKVEGSDNKASLGCERVCNIVDMGLAITLNERIIEYDEGKSYQYEVYEWKNFPIQKMLFGFTIVGTDATHTTLAIDIEYKAKPAFLTPLMAGKMRRLATDVLLGYKHFTETGEQRVPIKKIKARYKLTGKMEEQYG